ncbi:3-dehydroquinate synthase II family protein [Actinokineospora sp.]|uniref:3-dehydroquinate synthase II family protein n=1 Tax=Actinokineospora sp. TaxID=1872133 RepID=UPI0040381881
MKLVWIDLRDVPAEAVDAVRQAALHNRADVIVDADPARLAELPPTVTKVYAGKEVDGWQTAEKLPESASFAADLVLLPVSTHAELSRLDGQRYDVAPYIVVRDHETLDVACASAARLPCTVVEFTDPTKIPLEIVIAAADKAAGQLICRVVDGEEATIVLGVLEKGSDGLLLSPRAPDAVVELVKRLQDSTPPLELTTLTVQSIEHVGVGERVCVDTCSHFGEDEGILVGSFAHGFILCVSETHPLPYMKTRPFRVNAGALHSYVMQGDNRTNYLSELSSGSPVLAVRTDGSTRRIVVGRSKLERRPLLQINAVAPGGEKVSLTLQDDWHVRVLGPGDAVLNVTELTPGTELLGYLATDRRHVGYPVDEFCVET